MNRGTVSSDQPSKACGTAFLKGDQQFRQESLIFLRKFFLEVWSGRWLTPLEERPSTRRTGFSNRQTGLAKGNVCVRVHHRFGFVHQKGIHEGDDVLKSAYERNENSTSTNLGNSAESFWNALAVATGCLPKREKPCISRRGTLSLSC
jgi:hypothetical protein